MDTQIAGTLTTYVNTSRCITQQQAQASELRKKRRAAKAALEGIALEQSEAGGDDDATMPAAIKLGDTSQYLVVSSRPRTNVSVRGLMTCKDALTPADFAGAVSGEALVPMRTIITNAILAKLTVNKTEVKWAKKPPASARVVDIELDDEQRSWVDISVASVPPPRALAQLRAQKAELEERVRQSLPGCSDPNFLQELIENSPDGPHKLVLVNGRPKHTGPKINKATFLEFMAATKHDRLDQVVSAATLAPEEACALAKRVLPAILKAMNEWQARHTTSAPQFALLPEEEYQRARARKTRKKGDEHTTHEQETAPE